MSLRSRRFLQLLLPTIAVMCLSAAPQQQLNPTVKVLPAATSTVPPECEEGLAPQPRPRVTPEEKALARQIAAPPELQAPPTNDLRTNLRDVQTAAERNDRATFADSLARVKTILATYPSGAERSGAEKAVAVYSDINTLWDYQLTPPGAFFDASSDLFKMLAAYPGYDTFIRRQILVDQTGAKFYPSSESRAFLTQIAAGRLKDLGIKSAAVSSTTPAVAHKPPATSTAREKAPAVHETSPKTEAAATAATPAPHKQHAATSAPKHHRAAKEKKPPQVAEAKPTPARKSAEATTAKKSVVTEKAPATETKKSSTAETKTAKAAPNATTAEKPAATVTTAPPPATSSVATTAAPPASSTTATAAASTSSAPSSAATSTNPPAPATASTAGIETTSGATATETTATSETATSASTDTATTDTTGTAGEKEQSGRPGEPRNLLWPIILIVVGVGVLILLFRTSPGPK